MPRSKKCCNNRYLSIHYLKQWVWRSTSERQARMRLGKKISYISQYEYFHMMDKHAAVIAQLEEENYMLK